MTIEGHTLRGVADSARAAAGPSATATRLVVASEPEFDFLSPDYASLFERSCATAFQHPLWLDGVYRRLVPKGGAEPLVVVARSPEDGRLAMVLPLIRRRVRGVRVVEFADLGVSDYAAPVCDVADWQAIRGDAIIRGSVRSALGRFDLVRIGKIREDTHGFADVLGPASTFVSGSAHAVPLGPSFAAWRSERMDPSRIREFDQKRRKLARKGGLRLERLADPARVEPVLATMRDFRVPRFQSRDNEDILTDAAAFAFYADIARAGMQTGVARTFVLSLGDTIVAAAFGLCHRQRFLTLLSAFDAAYKRYSLGYLMFEAMIEECVEAGLAEFDLTIGEEGYKREFGTQATVVSSLVRGGSALGSVGAALIARPWTRQLLKRYLAGRYQKSLAPARG